jgi:hypothetical protein
MAGAPGQNNEGTTAKPQSSNARSFIEASIAIEESVFKLRRQGAKVRQVEILAGVTAFGEEHSTAICDRRLNHRPWHSEWRMAF